MNISKDAYLKMDNTAVNPNELYKDIDKLFTSLEQHLDLLQSMVSNGKAARNIIGLLDKTYGIHLKYGTLKDFLPFKNIFKEG